MSSAFAACSTACDEQRAHRVRHRHVRDAALAEEALLAREGAVDELVDEHEVAGRELILQRAAGGDGHEVGDAGALQCVDVGAVVDVRRRDAMPAPVARQEAERQAVDLGEQDLVGRLAPRARDLLPVRVLDARQIVETAAADDAQDGFDHIPSD